MKALDFDSVPPALAETSLNEGFSTKSRTGIIILVYRLASPKGRQKVITLLNDLSTPDAIRCLLNKI
jgi:hypothetical protein